MIHSLGGVDPAGYETKTSHELTDVHHILRPDPRIPLGTKTSPDLTEIYKVFTQINTLPDVLPTAYIPHSALYL